MRVGYHRIPCTIAGRRSVPFERTEAAVASSEMQHDQSITRVDDDACTKDYRGRDRNWCYPDTGVFDDFPGHSSAIE